MKIVILGTGAYGMALSNIFSDSKCNVVMWTKFKEEKEMLDINRGNEKLIPNFELNENIEITDDLDYALKNNDLVVIAIPAAFFRLVCEEVKNKIDKDTNILIATKGIEQNTDKFMSQIVSEILNTNKIAVLSGPSFAVDIVKRNPIGVTIATENDDLFKLCNDAINTHYIYIERSRDVEGVELCGSIKNVYAIIFGILDGLKLTDSTRAMLFKNIINEIQNLLEKLDCKKNTALTYAGIGDLILTCTSDKSRNYKLGNMIGNKEEKVKIDEYIKNTTIEGLYTLTSLHNIINNEKIECNSIKVLYNIMYRNGNITEIINYVVKK